MASNDTASNVQPACWNATEDARLLQAVLHGLNVRVAILDPNGRYLHRNHRFLKWTRKAGKTPCLAEIIQSLQEELPPTAKALSGTIANGPTLLMSTDVPLGGGGYRVPEHGFGCDRKEGGQALLIMVERLPPETGRKLPERLRLNAQETRVARLLAEGRTNKEVAFHRGFTPPRRRIIRRARWGFRTRRWGSDQILRTNAEVSSPALDSYNRWRIQ